MYALTHVKSSTRLPLMSLTGPRRPRPPPPAPAPTCSGPPSPFGLCPWKRDELALVQAGTRNIGDLSRDTKVEFTPEFVQYLATECPAGVSAEAIGQWLENSHREST